MNRAVILAEAAFVAAAVTFLVTSWRKHRTRPESCSDFRVPPSSPFELCERCSRHYAAHDRFNGEPIRWIVGEDVRRRYEEETQ